MSNKILHPTIQKFKQFVKDHPLLTQEVRKGNKTWQELYEDWYLFGEEDEMWNKYRKSNDKMKTNDTTQKSEFMTSFFSALKNIDINQVQQHISNASEVISTIQSVIQQFQGNNSEGNKEAQAPSNVHHPFSFRKD